MRPPQAFRFIFYYALFMGTSFFLYATLIMALPDSYGWWFTLIILFIPVVLYFAFNELMIKHWDYKLPFGKVLIFGFAIVLLAAVVIGSLHWLNSHYLHILDDGVYSSHGWFQIVRAHVLPYLIFALFGIPAAYGLLRWKGWYQNRKSLKNKL